MRTLKTKNKEELITIARDVFKRYPKAENVAITSDGTAFITDNGEAAVKNHSVKNVYGKKLAITEFTRDQLAEKKAGKAKGGDNKNNAEGGSDETKTAEELIAEINDDASTVESLAVIVKAEEAGKKRKTVLEAANAKLESLKAAL